MEQLFGMAFGAIAAYAPSNCVTNKDISARLRMERMHVNAERRRQGMPELTPEEAKAFTTSDAWTRRFIGFTERRFAAVDESSIDMGIRASRLLLNNTDLKAADIDAIIVRTVKPSHLSSPPDACIVQDALGIPAFDGAVPRELIADDGGLACSSWVVGLRQAYWMIHLGAARNVLLIGTDKMSSTINWRDRAFATVLGDAGTATWCRRVPLEEDWFGLQHFWSWANGRHASIITTPKGGTKSPVRTLEDLQMYSDRLQMDGALVKEIIVPFISGPGIEAALKKVGWSIADIAFAILHEANRVMNADITKSWGKLGFRGEVLDAGGKFGNTTSASPALALALNGERLEVEKQFIIAAFGGGVAAAMASGTVKHPCPTFIDV